MKKILTLLAVILFLFVTIAVVCLKPLDTTPYQDTAFYSKEMALLDSLTGAPANAESDSVITVGWSRVNLLPPFSTPIAIDAHRDGKHFEGVHDSIYVRAFVFKQGKKKIAYISADLLIIPPTVTKIFDTILNREGFNQNNIYFTATHTHTSIGAWYNSVVGEIFAGKYDERIPKFIASRIAEAITEAEKKCIPAQIGYGEFPTQKLVFNRLVTQMAHLPDSLGRVDSLIRVVKIEQATGEKAAIITFAAHNTVFHENLMKLSADWCGQMMQQLDRSGKINFASFSAGEVGSHGPYEKTKNQEEEAKYISNGVAQIVLQNFDSIRTEYVSHMHMIHLPIYLREPNLRVIENIVIRPWLFKKMFGDERVYMNTFQVGPVYFAGMPCDFSGELIAETDSVADAHYLNLLVTSFNGGYIGYITRSRWYKLNTYETRTMGWFGDRNGEYLNEILSRLIADSPQTHH
ncbi:MAG: neutral/alkaline non-lysosomal ceramidase N-terminal domain-containing protein [Chitinophagales bacterium]